MSDQVVTSSDEYAKEVYGFTLLHAKVEDALTSFEQCVKLDPYSVYSNRVLGWALYLARQGARNFTKRNASFFMPLSSFARVSGLAVHRRFCRY